MRFDDSLRTVMAADTTSAFGAQSAFRQLVDLVGRHRVAAFDEPLQRLRELRSSVPGPVRSASARSLALVDPPAELVAFFAEDDPAIAAPVLRSAGLSEDEWLSLLPRIGPAGRATLRGRTDLPDGVSRGLAAFGATDFTIGHEGADSSSEQPPAPRFAPEKPDRQATHVGPGEHAAGETFAIAELVERIETFQRGRDRAEPPGDNSPARFAFEADRNGVISWVEGISRAGIVGRTITELTSQGSDRPRGISLHLPNADGSSSEWRVSAKPLFSAGRLSGYRGNARRVVEQSSRRTIEPDALRRLVHELRTPTNAIAGFAELIVSETFGEAPQVYRARATSVVRDVDALLGAIEDLEISARIDGHALDLSPRPIDLDAALADASARSTGGDRLRMPHATGLRVIADDRALDRLLIRLSEIAAGGVDPGTPVDVTVRSELRNVTIEWPWRCRAETASLLGLDFSLRLAQRLATTLGGTLIVQPDRLTLHLPAAFNSGVQATTF